MYALVLILAAVGLSIYARSVNMPLQPLGWCFAVTFGALLSFMWAVHEVVVRQLRGRAQTLLDDYNQRFGSTSAGRKYLDDQKPLHEQLSSKLGLLALFANWHIVLPSMIYSAAAQSLEAKTPDQRSCEWCE